MKRDLFSFGPSAEESAPQAWLHFDDREPVPLRRGMTVAGRGERCDLVLDDPLVSRRHACFVVDSHGVTVRDWGSANGVLVNGLRIDETHVLVEGDRVAIGRREVRLAFGAPAAHVTGRSRADDVETVRKEACSALAMQAVVTAPPEAAPESPADLTRKANIFEMLSGVAEKALSLGKGAEAERILSRPLLNLLADSRRKRVASRAEADMASALAVKLAQVTGKAQWIDYVFRLGMLRACPPSAQVIDDLYSLVRTIPEIDVTLFRDYLDVIRSAQGKLDLSDRFLVRRLEGLRGVLASI